VLFRSHRAFLVFRELDEQYKPEVWASPAMFDLPILTSLWGGNKPWSYSRERCLMTLRSHVDPRGELRPPENTKAHDGAADAEWQMNYLLALKRRMYLPVV
jgi:hypothetical protein